MPENLSSSYSAFQHLPVLGDEIMEIISKLPLKLFEDSLLIDSTLGGGGHSELLLRAYPTLRLVGLDQDPAARVAAAERLRPFADRVEIVATNFADFMPTEKAAIVLADLGVSSPQLDSAERGFSFKRNGPLDMRMNPETLLTAADLIDQVSEKELADIIYSYGEERLSRRIARRIKKDLQLHGQYEGTAALAYSVAGCFPKKIRHGRIHPATKTFQALRIAVNDELKTLDRFLSKIPDWLVEGGLACVISFHSLEDRPVKKVFREDDRFDPLMRKPLKASKDEVAINPRSRSAKCRMARRVNCVS